MTIASVLALGAGGAGVLGAWEALSSVEAERVMGALRRMLAPLTLAATEGRSPSAPEQRRLGLLAAGCLLVGGWLVGGLFVGCVVALAGPTAAVAVIRVRRKRYGARLARQAPGAARALADAVSAGHSVSAAIVATAAGLEGAAGHELRAAARGLEHGERVQVVLDRVRLRARSRAWDTLVAAILIQREAGGDLAGLLRELADALQAADRVDADAESATAQARFTAWLVLGLPVVAAGIAELASPGFVLGLVSSPLSGWLSGAAVALQACAALCVHRLARVSRGR